MTKEGSRYIIMAFFINDRLGYPVLRYIGEQGVQVDQNVSSNYANITYTRQANELFKSYSGGFENFQYSGTGMFTSWNGTTCRGKMVKGDFNGKADITLKNGTKYKGDMKKCIEYARIL